MLDSEEAFSRVCVLKDGPDPRTGASLVSNSYFGASAGAGAVVSL